MSSLRSPGGRPAPRHGLLPARLGRCFPGDPRLSQACTPPSSPPIHVGSAVSGVTSPSEVRSPTASPIDGLQAPPTTGLHGNVVSSGHFGLDLRALTPQPWRRNRIKALKCPVCYQQSSGQLGTQRRVTASQPHMWKSEPQTHRVARAPGRCRATPASGALTRRPHLWGMTRSLETSHLHVPCPSCAAPAGAGGGERGQCSHDGHSYLSPALQWVL